MTYRGRDRRAAVATRWEMLSFNLKRKIFSRALFCVGGGANVLYCYHGLDKCWIKSDCFYASIFVKPLNDFKFTLELGEYS